MYNSKHWTLLLCTEVTVQNEDVVPRPPASKQNEFKKKEVEGNSIYYFVSINCVKFGGNFAVKSQSFSAVQLMNKRDLFAHDCFFGETLGRIVSLNIYHKTMFSRQIETNPGPAILYRLKWNKLWKIYAILLDIVFKRRLSMIETWAQRPWLLPKRSESEQKFAGVNLHQLP